MMEMIRYKLEAFEGPLDLLLHLISKNKVDIKDIPISEILDQYNSAIEEMGVFDLDTASDFVAMGAQLLYIKSKMLLPYLNPEEEEDPRDVLVQMLLEYQKYKQISGQLLQKYDICRNIMVRPPEKIEKDTSYKYEHNVSELVTVLEQISARTQRALPPPVQNFKGIVGREVYSVTSKISEIIRSLWGRGKTSFLSLFENVKTRSEIVATFLGVLELLKAGKVKMDAKNQLGLSKDIDINEKVVVEE